MSSADSDSDTPSDEHSSDDVELSGRKRLALSLAMLAILFVAAELMIRIGTALLGFNLDSSYGYPADLFVDDPALGFALKPGFVGNFPNAPYDDIEIRINDAGYRDRPFPPPSGRERIVVVGDSITFGAGVRAGERYTERLEESLCGDRCEVLNLGVNNYQAENYLAQMRAHLDSLAPDWVIIGFCLNDIRPKADLGDLDKVLREGFANRLRGILSQSHLLRVVTRIWRAFTLDAEAYDQRWIRLAMAAWEDAGNREHLDATLREIRSRVEARGARLAVVVFPERHQLDEFEEYGLPYAQAVETFEALGVPTVSLLPHIRAAIDAGAFDREDVFLPQDNIHFTPQLHAFIAEVITEELGPRILASAASPPDSP